MKRKVLALAAIAAAFTATPAFAVDYSISFNDEDGVELLKGFITVDSTVNPLPDINTGLFGRTITAISGSYKGLAISLVTNPNAPSNTSFSTYIFDNQLIEGSSSRLTSYGLVFQYEGGAANLLGQLSGGGANDYGIIDGRSFVVGSVSLSDAAAAVPELATWAMMLVGFGMMGGALRYRRRSASVAYA